MPDREKVIKGIDICLNRFHCGAECPYYDNSGCQEQLRDDALALLKEQEEDIQDLRRENHNILTQFHEWAKEQEAVEPIPPTDESDLWKCGNCNHQLFRCTYQRYCEMCGKQVKWE